MFEDLNDFLGIVAAVNVRVVAHPDHVLVRHDSEAARDVAQVGHEGRHLDG